LSSRILPGAPLICVWIGILAALALGLLTVALSPERAMKFMISPRRAFSAHELLWYRITASAGVVCFSYFIGWTVVRFLLRQPVP